VDGGPDEQVAPSGLALVALLVLAIRFLRFDVVSAESGVRLRGKA
jgi:hypothetical protein